MPATVTCPRHDFAPRKLDCGVYECSRCGALGRRVRGVVKPYARPEAKRDRLETVDMFVTRWAQNDVRQREADEARRDARRS